MTLKLKIQWAALFVDRRNETKKKFCAYMMKSRRPRGAL